MVASGPSISSTAFPQLVNQSTLHHFQHDQLSLWMINPNTVAFYSQPGSARGHILSTLPLFTVVFLL